ncbi:hypothetical protein JKF63_01080 [Porcisia hertigi]|uniref:Uncharacterized protein n=1 Tax=Porcisia hertigi TaxID=2761500 RepID=A0A836L0B0_9TRYP|nr:hypothetical protein JKF63_01080 [Porcisia hertigi]
METPRIITVFFFNKTALQYALSVALLLAPLYAFVLKPLVRWIRRCAAGNAAVGDVLPPPPPPPPASTASAHKDTLVELSADTSNGFLLPVSLGATPASFTPIFATAATTTSSPSEEHVRNGSGALSQRSRTGAPLPPPLVPQDSTPNGQGPACPLKVTGSALRLEEVDHVPPAECFVSAVCRHVQQRGAALFNCCDNAVRSALQSGEVHHNRLQEQYEQLNTTDASLESLYARPAFHEWYAANREQLLREMQLREASAKWHHVATATVLLVAFMFLPAYSFSTQTNAIQWVSPLTSAGNKAAVSAAPLAQLLVTRLDSIQSRGLTHRTATTATPSSPRGRTGICLIATTAMKAVEYVGILAAVCALITSCFMPHDSGYTASVALVFFLFLVMESTVVPAVAVKLGLGSLVLLTVVAMSVYRAAA